MYLKNFGAIIRVFLFLVICRGVFMAEEENEEKNTACRFFTQPVWEPVDNTTKNIKNLILPVELCREFAASDTKWNITKAVAVWPQYYRGDVTCNCPLACKFFYDGTRSRILLAGDDVVPDNTVCRVKDKTDVSACKDRKCTKV